MKELTQVLIEATGSIGPGYFRLNIDGGDPIYRERVYCYELYHQMRLRWPEECAFCLNGEIDKAAHPIFRERGVAGAKPDLLIHQPGRMSGNYAIIEVKSSQASHQGISKDLRTLALFRTAVGYERAIYLVYGDEIDRHLALIKRTASRLQVMVPIELWFHRQAGHAAEHILDLGEDEGANVKQKASPFPRGMKRGRYRANATD